MHWPLIKIAPLEHRFGEFEPADHLDASRGRGKRTGLLPQDGLSMIIGDRPSNTPISR